MRCITVFQQVVWTFFIVIIFVGEAFADGITLNRYVASETPEDGFYLSRTNDMGHLRFGVSLHLDYANDPLVLERDQGERDSEVASVVAHHMMSHLNLSLGLLDRLVIFAGLKANLLMEGDTWTDASTGVTTKTADGPGLGDITFGGRVRLIGEPEDRIGLALAATLVLPTGEAASSKQNYAGEESFSFVPEILFEVRTKVLTIGLNLGTQVRKDVDLGSTNVRDSLLYALGFLVPIVKETLDLHVTFYGSTPFKDFGDREATAMEWLAGLKTYLGKKWTFGLAGGTGLTRGIGSPDMRVVAMLGWVMPEKSSPPPPPKPVELDKDSDGILDKDDKCPDDPEDIDLFEDEDGCPEPDNDQDGVVDMVDKCPLKPEDADQFEDEDGCIDPDNDADGILDADDQCPMEAEDFDGYEDPDGCPDIDNDKDGVLDVDDACPLAPGVKEENGCPKSVRIDVKKGQIKILDRVEFATGKARILPRSEPILQEVAGVIQANPQLIRIRIEGHTDSRGRDKKNMKLSIRRAASVKQWLVEHGIPVDKLDPYGCGEALPIDTNKTATGRQTNRRVEFHITVPAPEEGVRAPAECQPVE